MGYIPRVTPRWEAPVWLEPYVSLFELALEKPIRVVVAAPPQHGKTESTIHGLCWALRKKPHGRSAYATYNSVRSGKVETKARAIAERDSLSLKFRQDSWVDPGTGGGIVWTSRKGSLTGDPVDTLLVIDDILKDRKEANSATIREECLEFFDDVAEPRCHSTASIIVMATRWHPDDLSGVLIKRGWRYLNLKALADGKTDDEGRVLDDPLRRLPGEPLCEARKSRRELEEKRRTNIYSFASLYQGEPRPKGGTVFREPTYYEIDRLPDTGYRVGYGVDFAYTEKTRADWSVCIKGRYVRETIPGPDGKPRQVGKLYIVDLDRKQVDAPSFTLTLKSRVTQQRGPMRWYVSGTEKGAGQFVRQRVPELKIKTASADKLIRATPVSEAWNDGRVLLPDYGDEPAPEWVDIATDEITNFTGVNDANDDIIDALAALWDELDGGTDDLDIGSPGTSSGWR
jgi:phage terminase large subunit-like protein